MTMPKRLPLVLVRSQDKFQNLELKLCGWEFEHVGMIVHQSVRKSWVLMIKSYRIRLYIYGNKN